MGSGLHIFDLEPCVADGKCDPNLYIIFSSQPAEFLKTWRRRDGLLFGNAWPATVSRLLQSKRPVKVWYNDGLIGSFDDTPSIVNVTGGQQYQFQAYNSRGNRALWDTVLQITSVIVVVGTSAWLGSWRST